MDNAKDDKTDKLYKVRFLLDHLKSHFSANFIPNGNFTVDESMVKWKGRLSWRQFMPNKPIRFGIKIWSLCDSLTGYMYNFQVYTGKVDGHAEKNLSSRVVTDLVTPLYNTYAKVCFDNFFTGFSLLQELFLHKIYAWGTVRANRKDLPKNLISKTLKLKKHEYKIAPKNNFLFVCWQDTKKVNFLSNFHSPQTMGTVNRRGGDRPRAQIGVPQVVEDYQRQMKGVDLCDQNVSYYMGSLKSVKWWRRLFFYFTQVSVFNSYVFAKSCNPATVSQKYPDQLHFIEALAYGLIGKYRANNANPNPYLELAPHPTALHEIKKLSANKRVCRECAINKPNMPSNRKVTKYCCDVCKIPVHIKCQGDHMRRVANR